MNLAAIDTEAGSQPLESLATRSGRRLNSPDQRGSQSIFSQQGLNNHLVNPNPGNEPPGSDGQGFQQLGATPGSAMERELVTDSQNGDMDSFAQLVLGHQDRVFGFLLRLTGNAQDAEDLAQDTFVKAYRNIGRYDSRWPLTTWLLTIARRVAANHWRSRRQHEPLENVAEPVAAGPDPGEPLSAREEGESLWAEARRLKPKYFEVLRLHYGEELGVSDVAKVMGLNVIHVKVLLHRARKALEVRLRQTGKVVNL